MSTYWRSDIDVGMSEYLASVLGNRTSEDVVRSN